MSVKFNRKTFVLLTGHIFGLSLRQSLSTIFYRERHQ